MSFKTIIYLELPLPTASSNLPGINGRAALSLFGLASDGVYTAPACYQTGGSLLHYHFTLTSISIKDW